ncbi:hypothetical protein [Streptomyces mayteni]
MLVGLAVPGQAQAAFGVIEYTPHDAQIPPYYRLNPASGCHNVGLAGVPGLLNNRTNQAVIAYVGPDCTGLRIGTFAAYERRNLTGLGSVQYT